MLKKLTEPTILLAALTGLFYATHIAEIQPYFSGLQLDRDIMSVSFHSAIYQGFHTAYIKIGGTLLFLAFTLTPVFTIGAVLIGIDKKVDDSESKILQPEPKITKKRYNFAIRVNRWVSHQYISQRKFFKMFIVLEEDSAFQATYKRLFQYVILAAGIIVILALYFDGVSEKGKHLLKLQQQRISNVVAHVERCGKECPKPWWKIEEVKNSVVNLKVNSNSRKLIFLGCGSNNCAGIDPKPGKYQEIVYFPISSGYSFDFTMD